ncbi:phage tail protein [Lactiplantibacillus plantarum]|nr:phage tail protein [Lactiplantibacillus plantarum]
MAESNATQVILTDDGIKIIKAQNTADNATGGVTDLNDPNLMSVIEKQTQASQYAGLTSQYNVILARAKEANVSTTDLTTAYTKLNTFMTAILTDTTKASDVDRETYKGLIGDYNTALSTVQTALDNSFNTDISNMQSSVSVASQAASSAVIVASQATSTGNNASKVASQALTTANQAQSAGNNATSVANNASQAASSAVLAGSTATSNANKAVSVASQAQIAGNNAVSVANSASQAASGAVIAGSTATVTANKASTAASQAQIAGNNATSIANNASQAASSAILAGSTATSNANKASADYQTLSAGVKDGSVVHITTETVIDKGVIGTAEIANGAITNAQIGSEAVGSAQIADLAVGTAQIGDAAITSAKIANLAVGTAQIANGAITSAKIANLAVGTAQIANAAITDAQVGNVSANKLTAGTIDFNTITGKNINASNITTGKLDTDRLNVGELSALSANLGDVTTGSLKGVDIVANSFSTPNGSFTTDLNGAITAKNMTLTGGTLTSPTINASTINGSTINGTTFNAGDIISSTYNTSRFHPTTITPAGLVATTGFNSMDGLRTEMSSGSFVTKYRAINSNSNQYEAYDGVFSGDELALNSGFTNGIDMGFQQSVSGNQLTGQVVLSPLNGIHLWGSTQSIHFSGLQMNGTGITFNSYGNIIADPASTWWRIVDFSGNQLANFGTDTAGSNSIQFNRELDIGNFQINTGHTFTSADGGAIHFAKGRGGANDIYAGDVHYNSLVKSSLLSVKKDVQKADTAYWAQLVNSIDLATYQYKSDDNTSHIRLSSIVDDVHDTKQWRLPDVFVSRDENGKLCGVDDSVLLNATLATVQEQQKEIDQLNGHLLELEAKLNG